jgi:hypothetical protein
MAISGRLNKLARVYIGDPRREAMRLIQQLIVEMDAMYPPGAPGTEWLREYAADALMSADAGGATPGRIPAGCPPLPARLEAMVRRDASLPWPPPSPWPLPDDRQPAVPQPQADRVDILSEAPVSYQSRKRENGSGGSGGGGGNSAPPAAVAPSSDDEVEQPQEEAPEAAAAPAFAWDWDSFDRPDRAPIVTPRPQAAVDAEHRHDPIFRRGITYW